MKRVSPQQVPVPPSKKPRVGDESSPNVYYLKLVKPWGRRPRGAWGHLKQRVEIYDEFTPWVRFLDLSQAGHFLNLPYHRVHKMITRGEIMQDARGNAHRFKYRYHCP
jgi:hypothetical protein